MILGTGIDILEISRIRKLIENDKFYEKMFTEAEISFLKQRAPESTAGYFCAKEAVSKALGTGFSGFKFTDIEILKRNSAPYVILHGNALEIAAQKKIKHISISISHCKEYASAIAIAEGIDELTGSAVSCDARTKDISCDYPASILKKRDLDCHKGDFGRVYVIGGSFNMSGAVILTAKAAIRTGAGLVTCVIPKSIIDRVGSNVVEATYLPCDEIEGLVSLSNIDINRIIERSDAIAIGVGIGISNNIANSLKYLIKNSTKPLVIDADAITMLASFRDCLLNAGCEIVLTPHPGEMARLIQKDIDYVNNNRLEVAKSFAKKYNCIVLLKGYKTIVTDGNKVYINTTGNPGMATGGSGDVLTGIITSLIGQGYGALDAATLGAYIHGSAGDMAFKRFGYGLTAGDITDFIGIYLKG